MPLPPQSLHLHRARAHEVVAPETWKGTCGLHRQPMAWRSTCAPLLQLLVSMSCLAALLVGPASGAPARATGFVLQRVLGPKFVGLGTKLGASGRPDACAAARRGMCAAFGGQGDDGEQRSQKAALRALWKIRASASGGSTALRAEPASVDREDDTEEPKSLLPASAYDDLPPLPNAIGQQQSRDYAGGEEQYTFEGPKRAGTVTILGAPNAGKSTLLNYLVGSKIAIVTHKRQTTRQAITGIAMEGGTQVVYIDTPGIMAPRFVSETGVQCRGRAPSAKRPVSIPRTRMHACTHTLNNAHPRAGPRSA